MKNYSFALLILVLFQSCNVFKEDPYFTLAFGSCNNQLYENNLWEPIEENQPDIWVWGGDIIYSDTEDIEFLKSNYKVQKEKVVYANFIENTEVLGVWDDHDYGKNDGGIEYSMKKDSQKALLNFLDVDKNDPRWQHEGTYASEVYARGDLRIKIILLDTRYFRTALTIDTVTSKRYKPNEYGNGTMLGEKQWKWLNNELSASKSDFNILVSSIQVLSSEHGYESWGNMPHEVDRLEKLLINTKAKNAIILSGDRHISEISSKKISELNYPLIDFTSSGMTHSYEDFTNEPNKWRVGDVVSKKSFGLLRFDGNTQEVTMEIRGENNLLLKSFTQKFN